MTEPMNDEEIIICLMTCDKFSNRDLDTKGFTSILFMRGNSDFLEHYKLERKISEDGHTVLTVRRV